MSDTAGMVRLMEHAADRLRDEADLVGEAQGYELSGRRHWTLAAMALAEGVLRMVACSAADGDSPVDRAIAALADYPTWAGQCDDAAILDVAELKSIERYFRTMEPS